MWNVTCMLTNIVTKRFVCFSLEKLGSTTKSFVPSQRYLPTNTFARSYSKNRFFQNLVDSIKQEYDKDVELKENIKKFRKETKELEDSDTLKKVRHKFEEISRETSQSTEILNETLGKVKTKISETAEELSKSEVGKVAGKISGGISDAAKQASESETFKKVQQGLQNIAQGSGSAPLSLYRSPTVLRMRKEPLDPEAEKIIEANTEATTLIMHKDSKWNKQWESFKNSKVGERISEMKMKYDESDNIFIRGSRFVSDKISGVAGGVFGGTDISKVMTEIERIQPGFSAQSFLDICRIDIIPNLLEAIAKGNDEIVKDWCSEAPYNQLMLPWKEQEKRGYQYDVKIIDLDHLDIAGATKVDSGPVLVVSFQTQQIVVVRNSKGDIIDGDENQVNRVYHVWALCRDLEELDPRAAWKVIDQHSSSAPMLL